MTLLTEAENEITYVKGTDRDLLFVVHKKDGGFEDLTGATVDVVCKKDIYSDTAEFNLSTTTSDITLTDPTNGAMTVEVESTDVASMVPGKFIFAVRITLASGKKGVPEIYVFTLLPDPFA